MMPTAIEELGNPGWNWNEMLKYMKKVKRSFAGYRPYLDASIIGREDAASIRGTAGYRGIAPARKSRPSVEWDIRASRQRISNPSAAASCPNDRCAGGTRCQKEPRPGRLFRSLSDSGLLMRGNTRITGRALLVRKPSLRQSIHKQQLEATPHR